MLWNKPLTRLGVVGMTKPRFSLAGMSYESTCAAMQTYLSDPRPFQQLLTMVQEGLPMARMAGGIIGREAVLGNSLAPPFLAALAHDGRPDAAAYQGVLNLFGVFEGIFGANDTSLGMAEDCAALVESWHDDLLGRFDQGERLESLVDAALHLYAGPGTVMARCWDVQPYVGSAAEIALARALFHDAVVVDVTTLEAFAKQARLPGSSREKLRLLLRSKATAELPLFVQQIIAVTRYRHATMLREQPEAAVSRIRLGMNVPTRIIHDRVDLRELRLILSELIWNAVKYADPERPEAKVEVEWVPAEADGGREAALIIRDNGIGIEPANLERIVELGFRERARTEVSGEGTGLWSVKQRLGQLGWRMEVISTRGVGTTFRLIPRPGDLTTRPS